jgi:hypothetical protein
MGLVKQRELDNKNIELEIIYGGAEAPFGGVDSSAPPAYIDPRCFAASDGFLVIDNKLVAVSLQLAPVPATLWNGVSGVKLLKVGTFYNSLTGQLNYILGYTAESFAGPPSGVNYTFYMTAWQPNGSSIPTTYWTDVLPITLFDAVAIMEQASLTLDCIASQVPASVAGSGATGTITSVNPEGQLTGITMTGGTGYGVGDLVQVVQGDNISGWVRVTAVSGSAISTITVFNAGDDYTTGSVTAGSTEATSAMEIQVVGPSGTYNYRVPAWTSGYTRQQAVASIVASGVVSPDITLSASEDGYSLIITANVPGTAGNSITVQDISSSEVATNAPPLYFSARTPRNLQGGQISESAIAPRELPVPASTTEVGGTLYIANVGPMILKYSGPGLFTTSTMYNGVGVIRKFSGSMIGLRLQNQLGVYTQNQDMIWAWTSGEDLDEWSPLNTAGNVTGAGFEQIADIGDYLTGLVISNGTAFIVRAQGISYATATGNATLPYAVSHVGLGDEGEGSQVSSLVCQYDQTGVFVGNSDIYQISGQISSIGQKIKSDLFQALQVGRFGSVLSSAATSVYLGGDRFPAVLFSVGPPQGAQYTSTQDPLALFVFNPGNGTWMVLTFASLFTASPHNFITSSAILDAFATLNYSPNFGSSINNNPAVLAVQNSDSVTEAIQVPIIYELVEGIPNNSTTPLDCPSGVPFILFPVEELAFGRDVTIDALYIALYANVSEAVTLTFMLFGLQPSASDPTVFTQVSQAYATVVLEPTNFNTLEGNPIELQVNNFSSDTSETGAFTAKSVQLMIQVTPLTDSGTAQIRITKAALHGSYDPAQRPV